MNFKRILLYLFLFIFFFCISYFVLAIFADQVWIYGFGYNISRGLVPYRDFNMIVTPLYSFIMAFFIKIFGNHISIYFFVNSFLSCFLFYFMYKKIKYNALLFVPYFLYLSYNGYNFLSFFLLFILLYLYKEEFRNKNFILGIIVGLMILTKQTVGGCVFVAMFFLIKKKNKYIIGVFIPCLLFLIYLIYNDAFFNFMDYCFFGMFDFTGSNGVYLFLPFELFFICLLLYLFFTKQVDKSVFIPLSFQIISAPIFDVFHVLSGVVVCIYYLFERFRVHNIFKITMLVYIFLILSICVESLNISMYLYDDKKSFLYGKELIIGSKLLDNICRIYDEGKKEYDNVFMFSDLSYLTKLNLNYTTNKFDLINDGNMGYNGEKRFIKEINDTCDNGSCLFIIDKMYVDIMNGIEKMPNTNQTNLGIIKYVDSEYNLVNSEFGLNIYSN